MSTISFYLLLCFINFTLGTFPFGHPPSKFSENAFLGVVFCVEHESGISFLKFSLLGPLGLENFKKFFYLKNFHLTNMVVYSYAQKDTLLLLSFG